MRLETTQSFAVDTKERMLCTEGDDGKFTCTVIDTKGNAVGKGKITGIVTIDINGHVSTSDMLGYERGMKLVAPTFPMTCTKKDGYMLACSQPRLKCTVMT